MAAFLVLFSIEKAAISTKIRGSSKSAPQIPLAAIGPENLLANLAICIKFIIFSTKSINLNTNSSF